VKDSRLERPGIASLPGRAAEAATSYHSLLSANPRLAHDTVAALLAEHERRDLMIQGRLLCTVLRPRFLDASVSRTLATASHVIAGILERAGKEILSSASLLDMAGASEAEREIWAVDPGYAGLTLTSRLDAFIVDGQPRFIEYNAESPAGIGYCDSLTEVFESLPAMQAWVAGRRFARHHARRRLYDVLLAAYREWGGKDTPRIAIVDWQDVPTRRDFELCSEHFRERGAWVAITDPRSLEYRGGQAWLGNEPVSLIYRRVLLDELLDRAAEARPLLDAYHDGAVCMVNSPRSKLLHKKTLFAMLSEGTLGIELTSDEEDVVEANVPWTRRLVSGKTKYHGREVGLRELVANERERFTIKPVDDYGGRGVVMGWETDADSWRRIVDNTGDGVYIVQERVEVPREEFPMIRHGSVDLVPLWVDTDPLLFAGEMGCILTRMSGSALLNVTAGSGSTTSTLVFEEDG
jgi:uncharacterized circularly permuted ATP-grasp superfamily protein